MIQEMEMAQDSFRRVADLVQEKQISKVLLVTGSHIHEDKINLLHNASIRIFNHYTPDKGLLDFEKIQRDVSTSSWKPELIVAVGGGRILDTAKLIVHCFSKDEKPYFIAIPSTAGSGSEATSFAVVYKGREKYSIENPDMLPDHVLLDAKMLETLPPEQRAISGIDAFSQAVESIWNKHATHLSINKATQALDLIYNNLADFVHLKSDERDQSMLIASYKAGEAIAITRTTGCHALSYYLTAEHDIPHGQAVGFFLPSFFIYNDVPEADTRLQMIYDVLNVGMASKAFEAVTLLMKRCGLATRFSQIDLNVDIDKLVDSVNHQRFSNNPVAFDRDRLKTLITHYIT
jgi:alcohol dehydrogenase